MPLLNDFVFNFLYGLQGYPRRIGNMNFRFDVSLRRWNFDGEEEVRDAIIREVHAGDLAVDVGANFGMHTMILAQQVGEEGSVIAFEPIPANLRLLRRNVYLNDFNKRTAIVESAISNLPVPTLKMEMDSDSLEPSAAISIVGNHKQTGQSLEVANQSLDAALKSYTPSKGCFIKIDVEGAELSVLRSATETLARLKPTLLIEVHDYALPSFGESTETVYAFLNEHQYEIVQLSDMSNHNGQYHHVLAKPRK